MRIRVVRCEDDYHQLPWVKASECTHWSMTCPRAKKAKKNKHKLKRAGKPGFAVMVPAFAMSNDVFPAWIRGEVTDEQVLEYDPSAFELIEKWYSGHWCPGPEFSFHNRCGVKPNELYDTAGNGGIFVKPQPGLLIECALGCGFKAAE